MSVGVDFPNASIIAGVYHKEFMFKVRMNGGYFGSSEVANGRIEKSGDHFNFFSSKVNDAFAALVEGNPNI